VSLYADVQVKYGTKRFGTVVFNDFWRSHFINLHLGTQMGLQRVFSFQIFFFIVRLSVGFQFQIHQRVQPHSNDFDHYFASPFMPCA